MSARYATCPACGTEVPVARPAGLRALPGEMDENVTRALQDHAVSCVASPITWEDLAEQQEMLAKAWTKRADEETVARLRLAQVDDAADAAGQAKSFRDASTKGAPLSQGLAFFLKAVP